METNKVYLGDCLEIMKDIPDKSVDLIVCDLPFGSTANQWDVIIPFDLLWNQYKRIMKNDTAILLFGTGLFTHKLALSNEKMYKYDIIWHKSKSGSSFTAKYRPVAKHENILVFGKGKTKYNPQMLPGEPYKRKWTEHKKNNMKYGFNGVVHDNDGTRHPSTVQFFQQKWRRQDQLHPCQKPIELLEWLIKSYSNEGDTILDNCSGSGTMAIAAINTNRNWILIEKDKEYYDLSVNRIQNSIVHPRTGKTVIN